MEIASLLQLQRKFKRLIQNGELCMPGLGEERYFIYQRAHRNRLEISLEADFPKTLSFISSMGHENFLQQFIAEHPSRYWTLSEVGRPFPDFVAAKLGTIAADLARYEWSRILAHSSAMNHRRAQGVLWNASVQALELSWRAHLWPGPERLAQPTGLAIYKKERRVEVLELSDRGLCILRELLQGEALGPVLEKSRAPANEISSLFSCWARAGIIMGFEESEAL